MTKILATVAAVFALGSAFVAPASAGYDEDCLEGYKGGYHRTYNEYRGYGDYRSYEPRTYRSYEPRTYRSYEPRGYRSYDGYRARTYY
jgi:hypothetical protein